jgi:hypothetical protein
MVEPVGILDNNVVVTQEQSITSPKGPSGNRRQKPIHIGQECHDLLMNSGNRLQARDHDTNISKIKYVWG